MISEPSPQLSSEQVSLDESSAFKSNAGSSPKRKLFQGSFLDFTNDEDPLRWDAVLLWFMRLTAIGWLAKGIIYWAVLFGVLPDAPVFEAQTLQWQSVVVYFSVIDLIAGIGLWLTSTWGGMIWLLAAFSYILIGFFIPHAVLSSILVPIGIIFMIIAYCIISWRASLLST